MRWRFARGYLANVLCASRFCHARLLPKGTVATATLQGCRGMGGRHPLTFARVRSRFYGRGNAAAGGISAGRYSNLSLLNAV